MPSRFEAAAKLDETVTTLAHNLRLKAELLRICSALTDRGIEVVVLKGIPLAERVYGGLSARSHPMQDNDILVRRRDLGRAIAALKAIDHQLPEYRTAEPRLDIEFEIKLHRFDHGVPLLTELHWHAFPPLLYPIAEELLWRHTEDFTLSGVTFKVLDPELTVLQLASHFVQHLGKAEWVLRDFAKSYEHWVGDAVDSELIQLARRLGLFPVLDFAFEAAIAAGLLKTRPTALHSRRARVLSEADRSAWLSPTLKHDYARLLAFALLAEPQHLPRWVARQVFPPIEVMALIYRTSVSPALYLRYISRLFRPIARNKP